jgi:hypothetical protein
MNLTELQARIREAGYDPKSVVVATREQDFDEWSFNVVPLDDGTFIVKQTDGRGGWTTVVEDLVSFRPLVFPTESALSEWLWAQITRPSPAMTTDAETQDEIESDQENLRAIEARFEAARAARREASGE